MSDTLLYGTNPATGERLQPGYREASESDVNAAVAGATRAFVYTLDLPPRWPADLLDAIADRIMALGDELLERGEAETALPRGRLTMERARTVNQIKMFADLAREGPWVEAVIDTADPQRQPQPRPDLRRVLRPRGPVAVFGASNFPFAFSAVGGDTASALAAGCPVIVKGHPSHPGTSQMFADAVRAALTATNLPLALFSLLQGRRHELGAALVKHPGITAVGFTGSLKAGRALFDLAAARPSPIPVYAEMGSVNPVVIMPGAAAERRDRIAQDLSASVLLGGGQFCTKPGLIFTIGEEPQLTAALAEHISRQQPVTMLNENLRNAFHQRIDQFQHVAGVKAVAGGAPVGHAGISPSLLETDAATWMRQPDLHEEAFGPAAVIVHCSSLDEAIACIDALQGSLTGTIHTGSADANDALRLLRRLEQKVGRVIVNGYPTGVEVCNAIVHGGPYPATTDPASTSVGSAAIRRWVRMTAYQDTPDELLPPALQNANPLKIQRIVNGERTDRPIGS